jgi:hypothetical protein
MAGGALLLLLPLLATAQDQLDNLAQKVDRAARH